LSSITPTEVATTLTDARRILAERGRCRGTLWDGPPADPATRCCPLGAIALAVNPAEAAEGYPFIRRDERVQAAVFALKRVLPRPGVYLSDAHDPIARAMEAVYCFNDNRTRSNDEVLAALDAAAAAAASVP